MKRTILLLIIGLVCYSLFAVAEVEEKAPVVTILMSGNTEFPDGETRLSIATRMLKKDYPNVIVKMDLLDLSDGSTLTMDAMIAAGTPPNILSDSILRGSKYMIPEYALDLTDYISDLSAYPDSTLAPFRRDGKLLGLPMPGNAQGMVINLELLADVGYNLPTRENWTIAEFLKMAQKVKDKYPGEKWATGMLAANSSGDYLINNWFASFGVEYYKAGDYSRSTIKETGGAKVYEFFQWLVKNEFIAPNSELASDDDNILSLMRGNVAATGFFEVWMDPYFKMVIDQGYRTAPYDYVFYPFPSAPGVGSVPTYYMNHIYVVHETGTEVDAIAAKLVEYINGVDIQTRLGEEQSLPNRNDVVNNTDNPRTKEISDIVQAGGIFDVGLTNPNFASIRPLHYPILQKVLTGEYTPDEAITIYDDGINEVLE